MITEEIYNGYHIEFNPITELYCCSEVHSGEYTFDEVVALIDEYLIANS